MNKKGFAVMFDWIFSLVAGVLIFSFLIYFAVQHTDLFGKVTARVVAEELDILFSGYETTETKSVLDFGKKVELEFNCDKNNKRQVFKINNREGKSSWGKVIFAPGKIESSKINVATMSWDAPFRVANFVFLWDKKYTLIGEIPDVDFLDNFQVTNDADKANIRFIDDPGLSDDYGTGECPNDWGLKHKKVIYYKKSSDDGYFGYICFFKEDGSVQRSSFYGKAMMIGAMFIDNFKEFECVKETAFDRMKIINEIYREKANDLISFDGECDIRGDYTRIKDKINDLSNDPLNFNAGNQIEDANDNLISGGCASVY